MEGLLIGQKSATQGLNGMEENLETRIPIMMMMMMISPTTTAILITRRTTATVRTIIQILTPIPIPLLAGITIIVRATMTTIDGPFHHLNSLLRTTCSFCIIGIQQIILVFLGTGSLVVLYLSFLLFVVDVVAVSLLFFVF